jgi:hypothetical protein
VGGGDCIDAFLKFKFKIAESRLFHLSGRRKPTFLVSIFILQYRLGCQGGFESLVTNVKTR